MSVINQVLNQLEQRGAPAAPEQTMVRVVPQSRRNLVLPLLALALVLAGGVAAWQWKQAREAKISVENIALSQPSLPITAVAPAVVGDAGSTVNAGAIQSAEMFPPASRLSFELSTIPLPSTARTFDDGQDSRFDEPHAMLRTELSLRSASDGLAADNAGERASAEECPEPCRREERRQQDAAPVRPARQQAMPDMRPDARQQEGALPMKHVSAAQRADAEFRKAVALMQQGQVDGAVAGYEAALRLDAGHDAARQALVALLLENKRGIDAERTLQDRLKDKPEHTGFAMLLARLQVERGAVEQALATLEKSLQHADSQADYHAFFAALLQRMNRHKEAVTHYQIALQLVPGNGIWLMGYGISLQEVRRTSDAKDAFRRALESGTLNQQLQAFVRQRLNNL